MVPPTIRNCRKQDVQLATPKIPENLDSGFQITDCAWPFTVGWGHEREFNSQSTVVKCAYGPQLLADILSSLTRLFILRNSRGGDRLESAGRNQSAIVSTKPFRRRARHTFSRSSPFALRSVSQLPFPAKTTSSQRFPYAASPRGDCARHLSGTDSQNGCLRRPLRAAPCGASQRNRR